MQHLLTEYIPSINQSFEIYQTDVEPELDLITSCTAVVLYLQPNKKPQVIMCKSFRGREHPGGRRELGESTNLCLTRELEEEIGLTTIDCIIPIAARKYISNNHEGPFPHKLGKYLPLARGMKYLVTTKQLPSKSPEDPSEILEVGIFELDDPRINESFPSVRALITLALEKI